MLKKLMLLAMMLAIMAVAVAPAMAQFFENDLEQEAESGDLGLGTSISLEGDNSNQCAPVMQFGNTGNNQNAVTLNQYFSAGGFGLGGGTITFEPEFENECVQSVEQAAAAG
jgi:hypothetical protein